MKHFLRIAEGLNTAPLLCDLALNPRLWDQNRLRTAHPGTAHGQASDIWVWFPAVQPGNLAAVMGELEVIPYPAWFMLPRIRPLTLDLMRAVEGVRLGRVVITRLRPGAAILPHVDEGACPDYYRRFQICLQGLPGNAFAAGDEKIAMRSGEAWWFDNRVTHSVVNNSADDRVVVIVDVRI